MLDLLLQELLPFAKILFSRLFSAIFWDIVLKFGIWICHNIIQIKFEFLHAWPIFTVVISLASKFVFRFFLRSLLRYLINILYMNCLWLNTDQVRVWSCLTNFYRIWYLMPFAKILFYARFPDFSLSYFDLSTWNYFRALWFADVGVIPFQNLLGPVGDLYCFSNTSRMLVTSPSVGGR